MKKILLIVLLCLLTCILASCGISQTSAAPAKVKVYVDIGVRTLDLDVCDYDVALSHG